MSTLAARASLARVARRQHGAFTSGQAELSSATLSRYVAQGVLLRPYRNVYVDPVAPRTLLQQAMAACLACGEGAFVSHRTAAGWVWGLELQAPERPEVTVPARRQPDPDGVKVYRTRRIGKLDVVRHQLVPVSSPARTVIDTFALVDVDEAERVIDGFWIRGAIDPVRLMRYIDARLPGAGVLRELLAARVGVRPSDSELERLYFRIVRAARLPLPVRQHPVATIRGMRFIDYAYPDAMVAIELDGFEGRAGDRRRLDDDDLRQNDLEALGWRFRRFTRTHLRGDPWYVAFVTGRAIGLRPTRWSA